MLFRHCYILLATLSCFALLGTAKASYCELYFHDPLELNRLTPSAAKHSEALTKIHELRASAQNKDLAARINKSLNFKIDENNLEVLLLAQRTLEEYKLDRDILNLLLRRESAMRTIGNRESVTIIGGGPLGLVTAIKAWSRGQKVQVFERRTAYSRDQIMGLDLNFQQWFSNDLPTLTRQMHELGIFGKRPGWSRLRINSNDSEIFDSVRIQQLENSLAIFVQRIAKLSNDGSMVIEYGKRFESMQELDGRFLMSFTDSAGNKLRVNSSFVVGADGARGPSKFAFGRHRLTETTAHFAGTAFFKADLKTVKDFNLIFRNRNLRDILEEHPHKQKIKEQLQRLGWEGNGLPAARVFQNNEIFYIGAEIPQSSDTAQTFFENENLRERWFTLLKNLVFPEELVPSLKISKGSTSAFPVESAQLDQFFHLSSSGESVYLAVGDNAMTPHFMTRSGINHGFQHVQEVENIFFRSNDSEVNSNKLTSFNHFMEKNAKKLFAKPQGREFFTDGPFQQELSAATKRLAQKLAANGLEDVNFHVHLRALEAVNWSKEGSDQLIPQVYDFITKNRGLSFAKLKGFLLALLSKGSV